MVMSAAGPEPEIYLAPVDPEAGPVNFFRNRFDLIRNGATVLTLKARTGQ